jgi:hypothetical protein
MATHMSGGARDATVVATRQIAEYGSSERSD